MSVILEVKDLCKTYIANKVQNNVLRNVGFTLEQSEFTAVMGPSGSGKSTLLYTVSGMDRMTAGEVTLCGTRLSEMNQKQLARFRLENLGFVFQQMHMMKNLCIMDNIILPAYLAGKEKRAEVKRRAENLMRRLGIIEEAERDITEVSGGELQRACICRALINTPPILFADEPTGSLNSKAAQSVMNELLSINRDYDTTILMVTHSVKVAACCDKVIYLMDGNIQGSLWLGKYTDQNDLRSREKVLNTWLMEQGW